MKILCQPIEQQPLIWATETRPIMAPMTLTNLNFPV